MTRHRAVSLTRIALIIAAIGALELACRTGLIKPLERDSFKLNTLLRGNSCWPPLG